METNGEIEDCLVEKQAPGNQWLAKVVLVAGTSCITPPFPEPWMVGCPPELRLPADRPFLSIPASGTLENVSIGSSTLLSPVESHLEGLIAHLSMPKSWVDEGVEGPTEACTRYSFQVVRRLFATYGIIPYKITASKQGAVFAAYKNPHNVRTLRIEVDNELDVAAVVSDGEAILDSGLLEGDDLERSLLSSFDPQLARTFSLPRAPGSFPF